MKKLLSVISLILAFVMITSSLPLSVIAAELGNDGTNEAEVQAPYAELGQNLYTTAGRPYNNVPTIDGALSATEGWVRVTPNGAVNTATNKMLGKVKTNTEIKEVTLSDAHQTVFDQIETNYYVAQDNDYVYVALTQQVPTDSYTDPATGITYSMGHNQVIYTYVKLGFNPADYTQQITLYSTGQYLTQDSSKTVDGVTYSTWRKYPLMVQAIGDNSKSANLSSACGIVEDPLNDSKMLWVEESPLTRVYEIKLKKSEIVKQYKAAFGADVEDNIDFSTMFIGATYGDYKWANSKENTSMYWANGAIVDAEAAADYGVNAFIPNAIIFGDAKDARCNYTAHNLDEEQRRVFQHLPPDPVM